MNGDSVDLDMTRGVYRKVYRGFIRGKRINRVSWQAEAWFWRLNAIADDYGNFRAGPIDLICEACPHKQLDHATAIALTDELVEAGLVVRYNIGEEQYASIVGFTDLQQPAGRNGRRIRMIPEPVQTGAERCKAVQTGAKRDELVQGAESKHPTTTTTTTTKPMTQNHTHHQPSGKGGGGDDPDRDWKEAWCHRLDVKGSKRTTILSDPKYTKPILKAIEKQADARKGEITYRGSWAFKAATDTIERGDEP